MNTVFCCALSAMHCLPSKVTPQPGIRLFRFVLEQLRARLWLAIDLFLFACLFVIYTHNQRDRHVQC